MMRKPDRFLHRLYEECEANTELAVDAGELAFDLDFPDDVASDVIDSLLEAGLIIEPSLGTVRITRKGIRTIEDNGR